MNTKKESECGNNHAPPVSGFGNWFRSLLFNRRKDHHFTTQAPRILPRKVLNRIEVTGCPDSFPSTFTSTILLTGLSGIADDIFTSAGKAFRFTEMKQNSSSFGKRWPGIDQHGICRSVDVKGFQ